MLNYGVNCEVRSQANSIDKPSITLIGTLPPIKGLSPYCLELLKSLAIHVKVEFIGFKRLYPDFLYPGKTKVIDAGYKIPELPNTNIRNILTYYNPFSWLWAGLSAQGEIVHAQWWSHVLAPVYLTILLICKARRKKIVITVHNVLPHEKSRLNNFFDKIIIPFADQLIVHTKIQKETLSQIYNTPGDKISIIPHGILEPVPIKGVSCEESRKWLGVPQDKKVILTFGNIRDYKGLDVLLQALALIKEELSNAIVLIAGQCWGSFEKYEKIIRDNRLEDYVIRRLEFIPPSKVEYYFSAANVVVFPYKYFDAQSGACALALPFKKTLVVTNVGGLPDFVKNECAIAIPGNPRDLADKLLFILSDDSLLAKLSQDTESTAKEYNWDKIARRTIEAYFQYKSEHDE